VCGDGAIEPYQHGFSASGINKQMTMKKVLLIDDDPIANAINRKIIEKKYSCRVTAFNDAVDALVQLKAWSVYATAAFPAVIFVDINMPRMNGWQFLDEFQKLSPEISQPCAVFLLTSSTDADDMQKSRGYRCVQDFISKPLTKDKLKPLSQLASLS
jgi:CheY-like chemotaxis protein